jgi:hypothetical protein
MQLKKSKSALLSLGDAGDDEGELQLSFGDFEEAPIAGSTAPSLPSDKDLDSAETFDPSESFALKPKKTGGGGGGGGSRGGGGGGRSSGQKGAPTKRASSVNRKPKGGLASRKIHRSQIRGDKK